MGHKTDIFVIAWQTVEIMKIKPSLNFGAMLYWGVWLAGSLPSLKAICLFETNDWWTGS